MARPSLRFVYDVVCPFAYLAFRQLSRIRAHADVSLQPVLLGGLLRHVGAPDDPNTVMAPARAAANRRDFAQWADFWGVPLHVPQGHPRRTVSAMRCLAGVDEAVREACTAALFSAYWERGEDITDLAVLQALLSPHGVDAAAAVEAGRGPLRQATQQAFEAGAFGVPTFLGGPRVLWGQDRIGLVLRDCGAAVSMDDWARPQAEPTRRAVELRFVHDVSSPFSYLASTQVERMAAAAGVPLTWSPILLGALFRNIGTPDVPLHAMNEARQAYTRRDMHDWAQAWGVPLRFPSHFPLRSVLPLRALLVEPAATAAVYRAAWAQDQRVDTPETLGAVLEAAGFDARAILERTADPEIKAALRENTAQAEAEGICGVPSFVVHYDDGSQLRLWGQDRLVMLRAALAGWLPEDPAAL